MTARTGRVDYRTNIPASINLRRLVPVPKVNTAIRLNWWSWLGEAESGALLTGDTFAIIEGPIPNGLETGIDQNGFRDIENLRALVLAHPTSSLRTGDPAVGTVSFTVGHMTFPGGIWSVEGFWVGFRTAGGLDRGSFTVGYEIVSIDGTEYQFRRRAGYNTIEVAELIQ